MPDWLSLGKVASAPGQDQRPIAWRNGVLVTRAQFRQDVDRWLAAFVAHPGRRLALYFDDSYDFAAALYAAWHAGKEVYLPGDAQPATLERLLPVVDGCAGVLPGAIRPAVVGNALPLEPLEPRTIQLFVYTSGSSGEPLAISKRLDQLDAEVHNLQAAFGVWLAEANGPVTVQSTVSHQHIYGLLFCTLWPLAAGRPFETERLVYPEQMAARLAVRACVLVSSPAHLRRLPETVDWAPVRASLRAVFSSGGPLPPESSHAAWQLLGHSPTEVFGSSETGGIAWRQRALHGDRWNDLPGVHWRLQDEVLSVCSAHLVDDQWWETSDRARALEGGGFVLLGRVDRIVKIEEKRVSLTLVESALLTLDAIAEAKVLVLPGPTGPRLAVVAVPTAPGWLVLREQGRRAFGDQLRAELLKSVERVALPRRFRFVQALPVNSQGKSTETLLSALFREAMPQPKWLLRDSNEARARLDVNADLTVFDGHFPGQPVLPGVAQVDWAIEAGKSCFALPPHFRRVEGLKFQRPVMPPVTLELSLRLHEGGGLHFEYSSVAGIHSSGRVFFGVADV